MKSLSSIAERPEHPLLVIPNDQGCLLVIGTNQAQKIMSKKEMFEKGMEFLRRSAAMSDGDL
jgi:hypothetical protein